DVVERIADLREGRRAKVGLPPNRRKSSRQQQRVVLAQRHIEGGGQPDDHLPARRGSPQLQKAQVPLRDVRAPGKIELRPSPPLAPTAKPCCEGGIARHEYLPSSCGND